MECRLRDEPLGLLRAALLFAIGFTLERLLRKALDGLKDSALRAFVFVYRHKKSVLVTGN